MSMFNWTCPTCYTVVSTFDNAPPTCSVCDATMEPADNDEPTEAKSINWFALAKAICIDPFDDAYWERERRYFEERDDRMFKNGNDSKEGETE